MKKVLIQEKRLELDAAAIREALRAEREWLTLGSYEYQRNCRTSDQNKLYMGNGIPELRRELIASRAKGARVQRFLSELVIDRTAGVFL